MASEKVFHFYSSNYSRSSVSSDPLPAVHLGACEAFPVDSASKIDLCQSFSRGFVGDPNFEKIRQFGGMEEDVSAATLGDGIQEDGKVFQSFQKSFVQVQSILDQNKLLINEINQNHASMVPDNLTRNVRLIRELNNNIRRVVDLYGDLSTSFAKSTEASSEVDSHGRSGHKRVRPG